MAGMSDEEMAAVMEEGSLAAEMEVERIAGEMEAGRIAALSDEERYWKHFDLSRPPQVIRYGDWRCECCFDKGHDVLTSCADEYCRGPAVDDEGRPTVARHCAGTSIYGLTEPTINNVWVCEPCLSNNTRTINQARHQFCVVCSNEYNPMTHEGGFWTYICIKCSLDKWSQERKKREEGHSGPFDFKPCIRPLGDQCERCGFRIKEDPWRGKIVFPTTLDIVEDGSKLHWLCVECGSKMGITTRSCRYPSCTGIRDSGVPYIPV